MGDNSFVYKKSEFRKNVFRTDIVTNTSADQVLIHSKMTDARVTGQISESLSDMVGKFAEHFGEEIVPYQMLDEKIDQVRQDVLGAKKLSQGQKAKRAQSAVKKMEEQRNLMQEKSLLEDKLKLNNDDLARMLQRDGTGGNDRSKLEETMAIFESEYRSEEEKEAVQRWMIKEAAEGETEHIREGLINKSRGVMKTEWMDILGEVNQADVSEFAYKSDSEFISEYAIKYEKISKYALADAFFLKAVDLEKKGELSDVAGVKDILREARARIEVFKKLKQEYDERMELISSPFYILLSESDVSGFKNERDIKKLEDKGADLEFIEYVKRYQRIVKSDVGKGKSLDAAYKKAYEADYEKAVCVAKRAQAKKCGFSNLQKAVDPAQAGKVNPDKQVGTYYTTEINPSIYVRPGMDGVVDDIYQELLHNGYSASINHAVVHAGDNFKISGLNKLRILNAMQGSIGDGMDKKNITALIKKICAVDRTDLDKTNANAVRDADALVDEGIRQYKGMCYTFLKKLESTYGTLPTQMHPEDFLRQVGPEFKDHIAALQDSSQLLKVSGLFDLSSNEEDKDFKRLTDYYGSVMMGISIYTSTLYGEETGQTVRGNLEFGLQASFVQYNSADMTGIGGPCMSAAELTEYNKDLKKRAETGGWTNRLNPQS